MLGRKSFKQKNRKDKLYKKIYINKNMPVNSSPVFKKLHVTRYLLENQGWPTPRLFGKISIAKWTLSGPLEIFF